MKAITLFTAFLICCSAAFAQSSPVVVQTPSGTVQSCWITSIGTVYCQ